jgi:hypothetical protein
MSSEPNVGPKGEREFTVTTKPLGKDHMLGLREKYGSADVGKFHVEWDHSMGYGGTTISMTLETPDGAHISETMNLHDVMIEWAKALINDYEKS